MQRPFFSITIPTKNRSFVVHGAITSILEQTFSDFEIVIIDNDDTEDTTKVLRMFSDSRIRHIRTGGLTMPDNWDRAYSEARGEYTLILEDKSVIKPRALVSIHSALRRFPAQVVSWPQDLFMDLVSPHSVYQGSSSGNLTLYPPEQILEMLMALPRGLLEVILPRGLNSCIHRSLMETIRNSPVGRLCPPASPDYTLAYLKLAFTDKVLHIDDCLTVYGSCVHSHGRNAILMRATDEYLKKDFGLDGRVHLIKKAPLKVSLVSTVIFEDYLNIRDAVGGRLLKVPLNISHFFVEAYRDLGVSRSLGVDVSKELLIWKKTLAEQTLEVRQKVKEAVEGRISVWTVARSIGRRLGVGLLTHGIIKGLGKRHMVQPQPLTFQTPLDYIRWDKNQPNSGNSNSWLPAPKAFIEAV